MITLLVWQHQSGWSYVVLMTVDCVADIVKSCSFGEIHYWAYNVYQYSPSLLLGFCT